MIKSATYLILMLCFTTVMQGQSLKFKSDLQDRATGTYSFTSERFTGSFSGSHKQVKLTLKNTSDVAVELHENAISLVDISGRGAILCHAALSLLTSGESGTEIDQLSRPPVQRRFVPDGL